MTSLRMKNDSIHSSLLKVLTLQKLTDGLKKIFREPNNDDRDRSSK